MNGARNQIETVVLYSTELNHNDSIFLLDLGYKLHVMWFIKLIEIP